MQNAVKAILSTIAILAIAGAIVFSALLADKGLTSYIASRDQENKNQAVNDCFKASTVTYISDKIKEATVTEPIKLYYRYCMEDKGYETVMPEK